MFTHSVLFAHQSPDELERRGEISVAQAVELFRTFPFASELEKREDDTSLTAPTIDFKNTSTGAILAIWSQVPGAYVVWFPTHLGPAEGVRDFKWIEECIVLFFEGRLDELDLKVSAFVSNS